MKICVLRVLIACALPQIYAIANEAKVEENLVTPYPDDTSPEVPIVSRLPHYDEITAGDQPDHHDGNGHVRFEETPSSPVKFEENNADQYPSKIRDKSDKVQFPNTVHNADSGTIAFEGDVNNRILTPADRFDGENTSVHKVKFDEPLPPHIQAESTANDSYEDDDDGDEDEELTNDQDEASDDDEKSDEGEANREDIDDDEENIDNTHEDHAVVQNLNVDTSKSNTPERVTFQNDSNKEFHEPIAKKKRKPRRKPRVHPLPENTASGNGLHPGYGYPGYPGDGFPGPAYTGNSNSAYPGYLHMYPPPGYHGYPTYPTPYPTPGYPGIPGYTSYPGYPGAYPMYSPYPTYQSATDPHPLPTVPGYPGQNPDPVAQADAKYPTNDYPGQPAPGIPGPYPGQEYAGAGYSGYPAQPGYPGYNGYGNPDPSGQYGKYRLHPGPQGYYRPPRRQKSLTQRAISAVAEALTSIALFDDKQCVPRLLCEVASGSAASSPTLQKASAGLGPLLTVLQSYNSASSSPLYLFGRAAVLGVTAKGNPTSCRYAYPQCPNDPEGLINYLNNHNGGFFRFFGKPENPNQLQNLEQFYSQLAGQYQPQQQSNSQQQVQNQQQTQQQQNYGNQHAYSMQNPYANMPYYGPNYYREQNTFRNAKDVDSKAALSIIEERIQNKPGTDAIEDEIKETGSKWTFPDEVSHKKPKRERKQKAKRPKAPLRPTRGGSTLKFPDDRGPDEFGSDRVRDYIRPQKGVYFPSNNHYNFQTNYQAAKPVNLDEYVFDYKHNFYVKRPKATVNDDSQTLYIVRGNGDPNHPEIVKVKPGQSVAQI